MATLAAQVVPHPGVALNFVAANGGGDAAATGAGMVLLVRNADASSHTVTLVTTGVTDGDLAVPDRTVTVAAGATQAIPLIDLYADPVTGLASWTYSAVTATTVALMRAS